MENKKRQAENPSFSAADIIAQLDGMTGIAATVLATLRTRDAEQCKAESILYPDLFLSQTSCFMEYISFFV